MKKIKFRQAIFKDGIFHHWLYWGYVGHRDEFVGPITIGQSSWNKTYEVKESQQFTGVRCGPVSLGVEIYEGDIVSYSRNQADEVYDGSGYVTETFTRIVKWDEEITGYKPFNIYDSDCDKFVSMSSVEVVGNKWENPELSEVKQ